MYMQALTLAFCLHRMFMLWRKRYRASIRVDTGSRNTPFTRSCRHQAKVFKTHVHDVCCNCSMFARCFCL